MGFNTAMIVRNDFLHKIEKDDKFGKKVYEAICYGNSPCQGFDILPSRHADDLQIVKIGANSISMLTQTYWTDSNERILRHLANEMGYRLEKK